jgi:hypothetical protein
MNDRWSELAKECWDKRIDGYHFDQEMFAELIVRECISCVGSQADKQYLRKHFGVFDDNNI